MRRARGVVMLAAAIAAGPAAACINESGTTLAGRKVGVDFGPMMIEERFRYLGPAEAAKYSAGVVERAKAVGDFQSLNDLAATTLRLGRADAAERLLLAMEKRWPGRYETATNLGTAYELLGRDEEALRWIREGIARNADSHWGTEWLHARILEAKVAAAGKPLDPARSLLDLDFGPDAVPVVPVDLPAGNDGRPVTLWGLAQGLRIQLMERTGLVPPPDPVVASLMNDLATLELAAGTAENAGLVYDLAADYGAPRSRLMATRLEAAEAAIERGDDIDEDDGLHGTCAICEPPAEPEE